MPSRHDLLHLLTILGNATTVLPLLAFAMLWLAWGPGSTSGSRRVAIRWAALCGGALALVAASKISYYAWGTAILAWELTCFSGHTVAGFVAWPALLMLLTSASHRIGRSSAAGIGLLLAFAIAASRVANNAHPPSEVIAGIVLGLLVALASIRVLWTQQLFWSSRLLLASLLVLLLSVAPTVQRQLSTERQFARIASAITGRPAVPLLPR